jgi:hypothetical protein
MINIISNELIQYRRIKYNICGAILYVDINSNITTDEEFKKFIFNHLSLNVGYVGIFFDTNNDCYLDFYKYSYSEKLFSIEIKNTDDLKPYISQFNSNNNRICHVNSTTDKIKIKELISFLMNSYKNE